MAEEITFAIGVPGEPVRMFMATRDELRAMAQCGGDEVAVAIEDKPAWPRISEDGTAVIAGEGPEGWEADQVRARRTVLLSRSDWTQVADAPLGPEQVAAWAEYRQALRDLPADQPNATLETVIWPEAPDAGS